MKRAFKSILSAALCFIMLIGTIAVGGGGFADVLEAISVKASADLYPVVDYIYYGTYPQTEVTDETTIAALNAAGGTWESYGYYGGSGSWKDGRMVVSDYMRCKDVSYNGSKYRAVTFDSYRPYYTGYTSSTSKTYQDDNGYTTGNVYWFKYEPIKWRVLDSSTGLIMCDTIIDSQAYNNYILYSGSDYYGDADCTYYANNYAESSIRQWLNNDFYNTAFSDNQKANILTTTLDNSAWSTEYPAYNSASTSDKVYLLSYSDVLNSSYGFSTSTDSIATARLFRGSDYAKAQGLYVCSSSGSTYDGCSIWRLRSASSGSSDTCNVYYDGYVGSICATSYTSGGVVPALNLQKLRSDYTSGYASDYEYGEITHSNGDGTHTVYDSSLIAIETVTCTYTSVCTATCTAAGKTTYTCSVCGYSYSEDAAALGHSFTNYVSDNNATCTSDGTKTAKCDRCNATDTVADTGSAKGHTELSAVAENQKKATCITDGSYDSVVYCSVCSTEISRETITVPATGHTPAAAVKENEVAATCITDGSYDSVVYCSVCNAELSRETITVPATGNIDEDGDGYCDRCGEITNPDIVNPCRNAKINIAATRSVDYKSNVTITATADNVPEGYHLELICNGVFAAEGTNKEVTYHAGKITGNVGYTVQVVDAKGNVQQDKDGKELKAAGQINCNSGFFAKIVAFFRGLFGLLPAVTIKP